MSDTYFRSLNFSKLSKIFAMSHISHELVLKHFGYSGLLKLLVVFYE